MHLAALWLSSIVVSIRSSFPIPCLKTIIQAYQGKQCYMNFFLITTGRKYCLKCKYCAVLSPLYWSDPPNYCYSLVIIFLYSSLSLWKSTLAKLFKRFIVNSVFFFKRYLQNREYSYPETHYMLCWTYLLCF